MKVIFLDIDGVLRTANNVYNELHDISESQNGFDHAAVRNLNRLLEETNGRIVVISSLRLNNSIRQLMTILKCGGVNDPPVIDVTPFVTDNRTMRGHRGREILTWLSKNPSVENYVVIDDCEYNLLAGIPHDRIVKTTYQYGFGTDDAYSRALGILQQNTQNIAVARKKIS